MPSPSSLLLAGAVFLSLADCGRFIRVLIGAFRCVLLLSPNLFVFCFTNGDFLTRSLRLPRLALPPAGAVWGLDETFFVFLTFLRGTTDFTRGVYRGESPCRFMEFSLKFCFSLFLRFSSLFHACLVKVAFTLTMRFNSSLFSELIFSVCFLLRAVDASCMR